MGVAYDRGIVLFERRRHALAIREFQAELAAAPDDAPTHAMISLCQTQLRQFADARASAETAITADPAYDWGYYALAWALYDDHAFASRRPGDIPVMTLVDNREACRLKPALQAVDAALQLSPEKAVLWALKAMIAFDALDPRTALAAADAGLRHDPSSATCIRMRALVLRTFGDLAAAADASAQALRLDPESASSHAGAGWSALVSGKYADARAHFAESLRIDPQSPLVRAGMLRALRARYPFYRPLAWLLNLSDQWKQGGIPLATRLLYVAGAMAAVLLLCFLLASRDTRLLAAGTISLAALTLLPIMAHALANYLLLFHPMGRLLLPRNDRLAAVLVVGFVLMGLLFAGAALALPGAGKHARYPWVLLPFAALPLVAAAPLLADRGIFLRKDD